jgi:hypothetical protein
MNKAQTQSTMNNILSIKLTLVTLLIFLALSSNYARAALIYSDHNTSNTYGYGLVYDSTQNITWYQSGTLGTQQTWSQAMDTVNQVNAGILDGIHGGWRLPTVTEMRNLYLEIDNGNQNRVGMYTFGPGINDFIFVAAANYWSFFNSNGIVNIFNFSTGQYTPELAQLGNKHNGWLVRDGNVDGSPVSLPAAVWLFGSALFGLLFLEKHRAASKLA